MNVIQGMYEKARTSIKSVCGETKDFTVKVGVHQGSALSPIFVYTGNGRANKRDTGRGTLAYNIYGRCSFFRMLTPVYSPRPNLKINLNDKER